MLIYEVQIYSKQDYLSIKGSPPAYVYLVITAGNNRLESIQQSESNRIFVEFDLSDHLQNRCQQSVPACW